MKHKLKIIVLAAITLSISACGKFLDVNDNPNAPVNENLVLSAKLPAALISTVNQETVQINQLASFWGGYWGTTSEGTNLFFKEKTYNGVGLRGTRDGIQIWEGSYNTLLYYQLIKEQAQAENAPFYAGIAKIMQAWHFLHLVDLYNNIPFEEALKGTAYLTPKYEDGKTVYEKSLTMITDGIVDIKSSTSANSPGAADVIFGGNKQLWLKFGNTLKLRALIRQSEASNQTYITAELQKITQEGSGFLGVAENAYAKPGYINTTGKMNPFWEINYRNAAGATANHINLRPTVFAVDAYTQLNDPRLNTLYAPVNGNYKGVLFGNPTVDNQYNASATSAFKGPNENANQPAALFKKFDQPSVLLASFESLFLQAEAAQRGWIAGAAKTFYEQAIAESFKYMEVPAASFTTYNAQNNVNLDQATDKIKRIIEQKWLALNSISSLEAWSDYRRLGFPAIPNSLLASPTLSARPLRLMYPESEIQTNGSQVALQGNNDVTVSAVWWDK